MSAFAQGKRAKAICDICGRTVRYSELRDYVYDKRKTGARVCPSCDDVDNEQLQVGKNDRAEGIALRDPRPFPVETVRGLFGWRPVGGIIPMDITLGSVIAT